MVNYNGKLPIRPDLAQQYFSHSRLNQNLSMAGPVIVSRPATAFTRGTQFSPMAFGMGVDSFPTNQSISQDPFGGSLVVNGTNPFAQNYTNPANQVINQNPNGDFMGLDGANPFAQNYTNPANQVINQNPNGDFMGLDGANPFAQNYSNPVNQLINQTGAMEVAIPDVYQSFSHYTELSNSVINSVSQNIAGITFGQGGAMPDGTAGVSPGGAQPGGMPASGTPGPGEDIQASVEASKKRMEAERDRLRRLMAQYDQMAANYQRQADALEQQSGSTPTLQATPAPVNAPVMTAMPAPVMTRPTPQTAAVDQPAIVRPVPAAQVGHSNPAPTTAQPVRTQPVTSAPQAKSSAGSDTAALQAEITRLKADSDRLAGERDTLRLTKEAEKLYYALHGKDENGKFIGYSASPAQIIKLLQNLNPEERRQLNELYRGVANRRDYSPNNRTLEEDLFADPQDATGYASNSSNPHDSLQNIILNNLYAGDPENQARVMRDTFIKGDSNSYGDWWRWQRTQEAMDTMLGNMTDDQFGKFINAYGAQRFMADLDKIEKNYKYENFNISKYKEWGRKYL